MNTIQRFKEIWEKLEMDALIKDRDKKLKLIEFEKEFMDGESAKLFEEEEFGVEEFLKSYQGVDEETKETVVKAWRVNFIA